MSFEENEISEKSKGGTEITKRSVAALIPEELSNEFQIIASRLRDIEADKIRIYWQHDLAEDPEVKHLSDPDSRARFHKLIFSSNWQLQEFVTKLGVPRDQKVAVIETPITPLPDVEKTFDDGIIRLVYMSTPQRGLSLLIAVFEELAKKHPNIHLDVYSSFKIYGWEDADKQFEPLYEAVRKHPQMTYHGFVEQDVLRDALTRAHVLAYPCTWTETSCRVLMESMSAGLMCVHPNLGALADTSGGLTTMYQYHDDPTLHAHMFYQYLEHAINEVKKPEAQQYLAFVKAYANTRFNLEKIAGIWEHTMKDLLAQYPTVESRAVAEKMFRYG